MGILRRTHLYKETTLTKKFGYLVLTSAALYALWWWYDRETYGPRM